MIYFDNAATGGRKPDRVLSAVKGAISLSANPGRSGHKLSTACAKQVFKCRKLLSEYFDGYGFERVAFTKNCTEALNIALLGVLKKGDHVVTTCLEHNSVLRPLEYLKKIGVITYDVCPLLNGEITPSQILRLVKPNTRLVAITSASNVTGKTLPVYEIKRVLPEKILLLCDGAQGAGHLPLPMKKYGIDLLALAGHKGLFAIQGSGALLFSDRVSPRPLLHGGTGSMSLSLNDPDFYPDLLEAGTLSYPAVCSLYEGVQYLQAHEKEIWETLFQHTQYFQEKLRELYGYKLYSTPNSCGITAFSHRELDSEQLAYLLSEKYDIAVRGGYHCASLAHRALKTVNGGLVRVSFSHDNVKSEIDELLSALEKLSNDI